MQYIAENGTFIKCHDKHFRFTQIGNFII